MSKDIAIGKSTYKKNKEAREKNKSPTKIRISQREIIDELEFAKKELKIHIENENHVMIAFKKDQIADLEKKIK